MANLLRVTQAVLEVFVLSAPDGGTSPGGGGGKGRGGGRGRGGGGPSNKKIGKGRQARRSLYTARWLY